MNGARRLAVLAYLALARPRGLHSRDTIIGLLWPEADQSGGRHALRNALHALRQTLGPDVIVASGDALVGVAPERIECDALALEADVAAGRMEAAIARYHGELLQGFHVSDASEFEHWLDSERRRLADLVQKAAWSHADSLRVAGKNDLAMGAARRASALAPDDEISLRRLVRFLDDGGDRAAAIRAFDEFAERLAHELEVEPSSETQALARSLREAPAPRPDRATAPRPATRVAMPPPLPPSASDQVPARRAVRRWPAMISATVMAISAAALLAAWPHGPTARRANSRVPIVVLPFTDETADTALAYVAPALAGGIADGLGIEAAIPYEATSDLEGRDSAVVRRRLAERGARTFVSGTVRRWRDSLELVLGVASVDGRLLRGARFRVPERSLRILRDSALGAVRSATGAPGSQAYRYVPDPEAAQLAMNAEYLLSLRTLPALRHALELYDRALERDPGWPELWLGRSRTYGSIAYRHGMEYRDGFKAAEHDAAEVLKRNPNDARAYIERAMARLHLGDLAGARSDALYSETLDTLDYHMQSLIGTWWQWTGDHLDSALYYTRRAERLAPWNRQIALNILQIVGCMPDSTRILSAADHVLAMDPAEPYALEVRAWTLARLGRWDAAADGYELRYPQYVRGGITATARRLSGENRFRATVRALRLAEHDALASVRDDQRLIEERVGLYEDLGWRDSSIAALESVVDSLEVHRTNMMCGENLRDFRRDPRVQSIVRRRGWTPGEFGRDVEASGERARRSHP